MLHNTAQLYGKSLGALDGFTGSFKDVYFDDQTWDVRHLVTNSATWLAERLVLLSPHAFLTPAVGKMHGLRDVFRVNLTRQQIENSPPISTHRPVSRQHLEEFHRYYDCPSYWAAGGTWGVAGFPLVLPPPSLAFGQRHKAAPPDDFHLRSARPITGYSIHAADGALGHLRAFTVNDVMWRIQNLIVEVGHWFTARKLRILPSNIERISFEDSTVYLKPLKEHFLVPHQSSTVEPAAADCRIPRPGRTFYQMARSLHDR